MICADSFCVAECITSVDCLSGARCIIAAEGNTCQPPEKKTCQYNSDCTTGLVCSLADQQCRNQCKADVDCPKGQRCTSMSLLCADPINDKNYDQATNELKPTMPDGGAGTGGTVMGGTGGTSAGTGGTSGGDGGPSGDASGGLDGPATPLTDGIVVMPNASVRPGQGNISIAITKTDGGLSNPTQFDLGGLMVNAQAGGTDTMLTLKVSVPHGAALGKKTLKFMTSGGIFSVADVVEVTAITVGPMGMDSNPGSAAAPFKTLKAAMLTAGMGDTIHLIDGTYNLASGEMWGYTVPDNVTIVGDTTEGTILDGAGATNNPNGFDASIGLTLKNMTIQHFYYGVDIKKPSSTVSMENVQLLAEGYYGINLEQPATGSTVTFSGAKGLINLPTHVGIYVGAPMSTVNISDGKIQGGSYVIQFAGNTMGSKLKVTSATIEQLMPNSTDAINVGVYNNMTGTDITLDKATIIGGIQDSDAKGSLTITGSTITQKYGTGIDFSGKALAVSTTTITPTNYYGVYFHSAALATMSLTGVTIDGGSNGVYEQAAGASAKLRGTTIKNSTGHGFVLYGGDLDLGTAAESGDNIFGTPTNAGYYCLAAVRSSTNGGAPVSVSGTAFGATGPNDGQRPAATATPVKGPVNQAPQLYTIGADDSIMFY